MGNRRTGNRREAVPTCDCVADETALPNGDALPSSVALSNDTTRPNINILSVNIGGPVNLDVTLTCGQAFRWRKTVFPSRPDLPIAYLGVIPLARRLPVIGYEDALSSLKPASPGCAVDDSLQTLGSKTAAPLTGNQSGTSQLAMIVGQRDRVTDEIVVAYDPVFSAGFASDDIASAVRGYFSVEDDVAAIEGSLAMQDPAMLEAVDYGHGLRILRQDRWECLASYVLSVNNNIPRISRLVEYFADCLGSPVGFGLNSFPSPQIFACQDTAFLRQSTCGFRDRNLKDAAERVSSGEVNLDDVASMPLEQAIERLMRIRGVGPKVADCVLLFGYHRLEVFPTDVWIARAMSRFYLGGRRVAPKTAREEGMRRFGQMAGYAQEYLFFRIRSEGQ